MVINTKKVKRNELGNVRKLPESQTRVIEEIDDLGLLVKETVLLDRSEGEWKRRIQRKIRKRRIQREIERER
jgi:hypothetical protein